MKNTSMILIFLLLTAMFFSGCAQTSVQAPAQNVSQAIQTGNSTNTSSSNQNQTQTGGVIEISIQNYAFNPSTLTVKAGDTVKWTNYDSTPHQIVGGFDSSPVLSQGETFEFPFITPGTYDYYCGINPSMKGRIVVQ